MQVCDSANIAEAARRACRSRRDKEEVAQFLVNRDEKLEELRRSLIDRTYVTSPYYFFDRMERGKLRHISDLPLYPDRIAAWAVALVLEPVIDRRLIPQTHASRKGHGIHNAVDDIVRYLNQNTRLRYALKADVRQFFPSLDKEVVMDCLKRVVKDPGILWFVRRYLDDYPESGIPLGGRLSPMLANLTLAHVLDYPLKDRYHVHCYVRYMDDIVILGGSKQWLHKIRRVISANLSEVGLGLKTSWQIFPIEDRGIDFVGYVVYRDKIRIRRRTRDKLVRACNGLSEKIANGDSLNSHDVGTVWSYNGILKHCDSRGLRRVTTGPLVREIVSDKSRAQALREWIPYFEEMKSKGYYDF